MCFRLVARTSQGTRLSGRPLAFADLPCACTGLLFQLQHNIRTTSEQRCKCSSNRQLRWWRSVRQCHGTAQMRQTLHFFFTDAAPAGAVAADASSNLPPGPWLACCSSPGATNMTWLQAASSLPSEAVMRINTSSKEPTCMDNMQEGGKTPVGFNGQLGSSCACCRC